MFSKLRKYLILCLCFAFLFVNSKCSDDDEVDGNCGPAAVIDYGYYNTAESNNYDMVSANITGNCLNVEIAASGCDGSNWSLVLLDSGDIAESNPVQRDLKLVFSNLEDCQAFVSQTRVFDLANLQIPEDHSVILNIDGLDESLTYIY
jgi:hypothetical protein